MNKPLRMPFRDMTPEAWQNLALAALAIFYIAQLLLDVVWHNLCGHLGVDFCAFWSGGHIANTSNYANMYALGMLEKLERSLFPKFGDPATFAISPIAYLPIFMLPFQALALLPPAPAFWIWTLLNTAALGFYLRFFMHSIRGEPLRNRLLILMLLSLPVYWNLLDGQVSVWLMICIGEFLRAAKADRLFRAGLWLGGILLKPQNLILLGIVLLTQRSWKAVTGLVVSSFVLMAVSFVMVGPTGFVSLLGIWLGFAQGITTNYVEIMMNWRMLGQHLSTLAGPALGWTVAGVGMLATISAALYLWRRRVEVHSSYFSIAILGMLAATGLVAWHSHIPAAMMLIPPLLLLEQERILPKQMISVWVLVPAAAYVAAFLLAAILRAQANVENSIISTSQFLNFIRGGSEFAMNLYLLIWSVRVSARAHATQPAPSDLQAPQPTV